MSGVLDKNKNLLPHLDLSQIQTLKADETIYGGMLPKIESCEHAIDKGCKAALIFDGKNAANVSVILNEVHYALSHNDFSKLNYGTLITQ